METEDKGRTNLRKEILRLTAPNVISNITVPLIGMADVAIAGHAGSDFAIGGVAIGTTVFNMIYWNCAFLRMGGSGITAQNYGAGNLEECALTGLRSLIIGLALSLTLLLLKPVVAPMALSVIGGSSESLAEASTYVNIRYWAIPASVSLFALTGWFVGMQDPRTPMIIALVSNAINVAASWLLALRAGMGVAGVAWGTVIAQYSGLAMSLTFASVKYGQMHCKLTISHIFLKHKFVRLLSVNRDIFLRTLCIVFVFTSFTSISARYGDSVLAANALMMQFFTLFSYMTDGLAYAAESLCGKLIGAGDRASLKNAVLELTAAGLAIAILYTIAFATSWRSIFNAFDPSANAIEVAASRIGWAIAVPLSSFFAFIADGVMIGATNGRAMRNTMAAASAIFFAVYAALRSFAADNALWAAFLCYMASRGMLMLPHVRRLVK